MKLLLVIACVVAVSQTLSIQRQWHHFKSQHQKQYENTSEEEFRYATFMKNVKAINEHNELYKKGLETYSKAVNQFSDLTGEEFLTIFKSKVQRSKGQKEAKPSICHEYEPSLDEPVRDAVDWRETDDVTPVKNQGSCGSCYAFSSTGAMESHYKIKHNKTKILSEQILVDCSTDYGNDGCRGGQIYNSFQFVMERGIGSRFTYPYYDREDTCTFLEFKSVLSITGCKSIKSGKEEHLKHAINFKGPVSVSIHVTDNLQSYENGVFKDSTCKNDNDSLDHSVLVVGYGTSEEGGDYWIVKNSWAKTWGEDGYVRIARNLNNHCGVATQPFYPIIS